MYHYVRPDEAALPHGHHLPLDAFRRQLDWCAEHRGFVKRDAFEAMARGQTSTLPNGVVLTFDDGLLDHYKYVFPELQARGLWGIFFVCTGPWVTGRLLDVHALQFALGMLGADRVGEILAPYFVADLMDPDCRARFAEAPYARQTADARETWIKRAFNWWLFPEVRVACVETLGRAVRWPTASEWYLSEDEADEMLSADMMIGMHTHTHPVLSFLSPRRQLAEIGPPFHYAPALFAYPYGGDHAFTDDTKEAVEIADYDLAFSVDPRDVTPADLKDRWRIPRYDCNAFPHGNAWQGPRVTEEGAP
jgi:peptidoglycan/xylan/chitin deacetylase (PgdA/CDA1 family)